MFMALRRLRKPCWLVEYPGEAHVLRSSRDRTVRLKEFFDRYLMGKPMPAWMERDSL